jgi:glycosyltransferase involved in cell wall biosynthesis
MQVSLILVTVGRASTIGRCLRLLKAQPTPRFGVLVVDQNADDRLSNMLLDARPPGVNLQHLRLSQTSLSRACKIGLAGSGVRDVTPCYARLAERAGSHGYPSQHRAGTLRLDAEHYINVARERKRNGDRKGSLGLVWSVSARRRLAYWLRTLPGILSPRFGPIAPTA